MTEEWMVHAKCRGLPLSWFFLSNRAGLTKAKKICASCPVQAECLEFALENQIEHGVWGGCSERQRRRISMERRLVAEADGAAEAAADDAGSGSVESIAARVEESEFEFESESESETESDLMFGSRAARASRPDRLAS